jgi:protein TonB
MSDTSLPRQGYAAHRSPSAFAAAIVLNGGVFAALIAIPAAEVIRWVDPGIEVINVPINPPPPPNPVEKEKAKVEPNRTQRVTPQPTLSDPIVVPPIVETGGGFITGVEPLGPVGTGGDILPIDPPKPPVLTKAKLDPRFADSFKPDYPPALRREGLEGSATVRVTIDERGRVVAVDLVKATDPRFFEETKEQALRHWRFQPARRDGVATSSEQTMTVHFRLEDMD